MMTAQATTRGQEAVTRFAPSPTGRLHLGHAYSAVLAHDRGRFLLRIEDIDGARSRPEHVAGIIEDLAWLGLVWDGPIVFQSARLKFYADALDRLKAMGLVYRCFCTRAEVAASLGAPHGPGAVYPGTCRAIDGGLRADEPHCWRIAMAKAVAMAGPLTWEDEIAGRIVANAVAQGDVVIARKDAPASYHLAMTIDDATHGITHVIRGADLFDATDIHRLLQALLGLPTPIYRHHPLIVGADGERLAKRTGAPTLADLRESGVDGRALAADLRSGRLPIGFATANA